MKKLTFSIILIFLFLYEMFSQDVPVDKWIYIQSVQASNLNGYWDQPGDNAQYKEGISLILSKFEYGIHDRMYKIVDAGDGWYNIIPKNSEFNGRLDLNAGNTGDGAKLIFGKKNNSETQKFKIKHIAEDRYKIYIATGKAICTPRSFGDGTPVHIWSDHEGPWMEWRFIEGLVIKSYDPDKVPKYPAFFKDNSLKTFRYTLSSMVSSYEGTAKVINITGNITTLATTCSGKNPETGKEETVKSVMKIEYKNGKYYSGKPEYMYCGEISIDGTYMDLRAEESVITLRLK